MPKNYSAEITVKITMVNTMMADHWAQEIEYEIRENPTIQAIMRPKDGDKIEVTYREF